MRGRHPQRTPIIPAIPLVLLIGFAVFPSFGQGRRECLTSDVSEAFTLPDGTVHPAGRLSMCTVLSLNPVTGVHRVWIAGQRASFVLTRRTRAEAGPETHPAFLFKRSPGVPLELTGFVVSDGRRAWTYSLRREAERFAAAPTPDRRALTTGTAQR